METERTEQSSFRRLGLLLAGVLVAAAFAILLPGSRRGAAGPDGTRRTYDDFGRLVAEIRVERGQVIWHKVYWPNGNLRFSRTEDIFFRTVTRVYDENGRITQELVSR